MTIDFECAHFGQDAPGGTEDDTYGVSGTGGVGGTTSTVRRVGIIGLGLIGGSVALNLLGKLELVGYDIDAETINAAQDLGIPTVSHIDALVSFADLIMICTPIESFQSVANLVAESYQKHASAESRHSLVVADTCSVKRAVHSWASRMEEVGIYFVGSHPMAGKHNNGIRAADPALFANHSWALSITDTTDLTALLAVAQIIIGMQAELVPVDPAMHDRSVAIVSHLPHVIASVMATMLANDTSSALGSSLAAGSFEDMVRVAGSPPSLSSQMCNANLDLLLDAFQHFQTALEPARDALASANDVPSILNGFFTEGNKAYASIHASGDPASTYASMDIISTVFSLDDQRTLYNWMLGLGHGGGRIVEIGYPSPAEVAISFILPPKFAATPKPASPG